MVKRSSSVIGDVLCANLFTCGGGFYGGGGLVINIVPNLMS